jgi:hypothetical protein
MLYELFYRIAFVVTGFLHLYFNDLVKAVVTTVALCLSDSKRPLVQSIVRLHSVVLTCFVVGFCFNVVTAHSSQGLLQEEDQVLNVRCPGDALEIQNGKHGLTCLVVRRR